MADFQPIMRCKKVEKIRNIDKKAQGGKIYNIYEIYNLDKGEGWTRFPSVCLCGVAVTGPLRGGRLRVPVLGAVRQPGFWGEGLCDLCFLCGLWVWGEGVEMEGDFFCKGRERAVGKSVDFRQKGEKKGHTLRVSHFFVLRGGLEGVQ